MYILRRGLVPAEPRGKLGSMLVSQLEKHRAKLVALRSDLLAEGDLPLAPASDNTDEDEAPLAEMNQVIASKRNRERATILKRVDGALRRLESDPDEFGLCSECGEEIGRRLEAMPYVDLCVECQHERDGSPKKGSRRSLTDYR